MPTKQVLLRLGESVLDYLCLIAHKSQAALVAHFILTAYQAPNRSRGPEFHPRRRSRLFMKGAPASPWRNKKPSKRFDVAWPTPNGGPNQPRRNMLPVRFNLKQRIFLQTSYF